MLTRIPLAFVLISLAALALCLTVPSTTVSALETIVVAPEMLLYAPGEADTGSSLGRDGSSQLATAVGDTGSSLDPNG